MTLARPLTSDRRVKLANEKVNSHTLYVKERMAEVVKIQKDAERKRRRRIRVKEATLARAREERAAQHITLWDNFTWTTAKPKNNKKKNKKKATRRISR